MQDLGLRGQTYALTYQRDSLSMLLSSSHCLFVVSRFLVSSTTPDDTAAAKIISGKNRPGGKHPTKVEEELILPSV